MAVELVDSMGYDQALLHCDNLIVINELKPQAKARSLFKLDAARNRFLKRCSKLRSWDLIHTPRTYNFIAHNIAKWAKFTNIVGNINRLNLGTKILDDYVEWSRDNGCWIASCLFCV
ncbi:hypothetical protein F8388_020321 [Cannabis sativa]|uniref:RNase H type-1 domain-containing protein n=1 Tax=Cannabis sativa TaxID=3483 RepID=A0A7J6FYE8_CANSA|nr:hypothetical protein F8388_020321 [Cannabis sativa]